MILATPFIPEITDYADYASVIRKKGKLLAHTHLIVSRPEDEEAAYEFGEKMSDLFLKSHTAIIAADQRNGNQLAVDLFRAATKFCHEYVHGEGELAEPAMLYMDPSYRPLENGWLDRIQSAYYLKRAPLVFGRFTKEEQKILIGPVVLNKAFHKSSGLLPFVPPNTHYRTYMQHEFRQNAVETFLIGPGSQDSVLRQQKPKKPAAA